MVAAILVSLITLYEDAVVLPNFTAVAPVNPVPVTITEVQPRTVPVVGETPVTVGAGVVELVHAFTQI